MFKVQWGDINCMISRLPLRNLKEFRWEFKRKEYIEWPRMVVETLNAPEVRRGRDHSLLTGPGFLGQEMA